MKFQPIIKDVNGTPGFYRAVDCSDMVNCVVQKCNNDPRFADDAQCQSAPFNMYFSVVIQAYLETPQGGFVGIIDESISFPVEILDPCGADEIWFQTPLDSFTYYLKTPIVEDVRSPVIAQTNPGLCPVQCSLADAGAGQNSVGDIINMIDNEFGVIRLFTGVKTLNGLTFSYSIRCESLKS